ncbi:hypothetical protein DKX38_003813 [Salix brachista]|uniref:Nucleosome assembly protein n=1 Tax=Salix brachista TaxID=2182728 RepID=A0A5N5N995_9ROSI|nr:hypothetical protein DKX38_003813 [Salix brachista]
MNRFQWPVRMLEPSGGIPLAGTDRYQYQFDKKRITFLPVFKIFVNVYYMHRWLLQNQHDELEAQFIAEKKALEAKYQKLYQPLYTKRFEIVNGAELAGIKEDQATEEKGVPGFWLAAMKTHEVLAAEIEGQDEGALKFINDIKWSRLQNPEGFKLEFYFNPNPYFKNSVLTKTYHVVDESDPILSQSIGTEIEWYPGKCLTRKVTVKKKPRMGSNIAKNITTISKCESFFTFFTPPRIPENEDGRDDDAYDELQDRMEQDYNVG